MTLGLMEEGWGSGALDLREGQGLYPVFELNPLRRVKPLRPWA